MATNYEERFAKIRKQFESEFGKLYTEVRFAGWEWEADEELDELLDRMQDDLAEFDKGDADEDEG